MNKEFITYKFYNEKRQRLTIWYDGDNTVTVLPCNNKDQFSKKVGNSLVKNTQKALYSKRFFGICFYNEKDFLNWCRVSYYKLQIIDRQKDSIKLRKTLFKYVINKQGKIKEYHLFKETIL